MRKVAFHTLGCKVNTYESQAMLKEFVDAGYEEVDFKSEADVYVINTCTVTNTGDSKSRQMIRKAVRKNPEAVICVVGCYSQIAPKEIEAIEGVSIVLGTQYRNEIISLVDEYLENHQTIVKVDNVMKLQKFEDLNIDRFKNTRAYIKIQDGCNNFCTYCIIPYARGGVRSRMKESVLEQITTLVKAGYIEIVLTGIHTAGYGQDFEDYNFYNLLEDIVKIEGLQRLRISSIEISQVTREIMELIATNTIVVDHLHVPLQSGCDATLKRMNRKYDTKQYLEKIEEIRNYIPSVKFTTDVIVGFPGESEEEFEATCNFIKEVGFSMLHVFPYSIRKNTPAAKMKDQVDEKVKHQRTLALVELSNELLKETSLHSIGEVHDVLFEKKTDYGYIGHARNYLQIEVESDINLIGTTRKVEIVSYDGTLKGRVQE